MKNKSNAIERGVITSESPQVVNLVMQGKGRVVSRPFPLACEIACQVRIAIDGIRFAVTHIEGVSISPDVRRETSIRLLDAFDRLRSARTDDQVFGQPESEKQCERQGYSKRRCSGSAKWEASRLRNITEYGN